ncbi:MAG: sensor histidine kinase [Nocardioidaceae bacterium]
MAKSRSRDGAVPRARRGPRWTALGAVAAVASVAATTGVIFGLREVVPVLSTGVVYLLAVLLVASVWSEWLGLLTALLSAAAFNFFHIPPTGEFTIAEGEDWLALAVFLVAAAVAGTLAHSARARAEEAERRRGEADLAAEMATLLLRGESTEEALSLVGRRIAATFELASASVELAWLSGDERRLAIPLVASGGRVGTLMVPRGTTKETQEELRERVVPALEALIGATRRRDELEAQVVETKALRRSNVLKTTLLRWVSHDLRSPITSITAAAGGLASAGLSDDERRELAAVISSEASRLARLVDNLLDLTRLQSGSAEPQADWCAIEDAIRAAVDAAGGPGARFDVQLDDDIPLIKADEAQLERALANVFENSARYADGQPVAVRARAAGASVIVRVSDRGPGIPREELERIFEPFYRSSARAGAGSGLGLAIARGFVEVNGGTLRAESLPGQGTTFVFRMPVPTDARARRAATERQAT